MGTSYDISLCIDYKLSDCPIQQSISRPRNTRCGLFNSTGLEPTQQLCEPTILHNSQSLKNSKSAKSVCDINSAVLEVKAMASDVKVNVSMLPNQNSELHPNVHQHGSTTGTFKQTFSGTSLLGEYLGIVFEKLVMVRQSSITSQIKLG